jgi:FkbM family methyltransferase
MVRTACGDRWPWAIKHLPRVGTVNVQLPNGERLRLWSRGDDWVSNQVFWRGWYEPEASRLFFEVARRSPLTIDVGAHVGYYALLAALANCTGSVIAVEPVPTAVERIERNIRINDLTNVEVIKAAAAATSGTAEFFYWSAGVPCSAGLSSEWAERWGGASSFQVRTLPLDQLIGERRVGLAKLDTETTEPDALRGMATTLERDRPLIFCEVLPGEGAELREVLGGLGYSYHLLTDEGSVQRDVIEGDDRWHNWLFAPQGSDAPLPWVSSRLTVGRALTGS